MTQPRIAPLEPPYDPATEQMLSKWMPPESRIEPLRLFRTLAVHESLFGRMLPLGATISFVIAAARVQLEPWAARFAAPAE